MRCKIAEFGLVVCVLGSTLCFAQDRVTYTPEGASKPITVIGEVVEYTGRDLIVRSLSSTKHLSPERVERIETNYDPAHLRGIEEFNAGDATTAQASFREALGREHRHWVQREIHSWLVRCAMRNQDLAGALREFRLIVLTDPQTRHWNIAPLIWSPMSISQPIRTEMQSWLESNRESERLLASSLLLLDPVSGEAAEDELKRLSRDLNPLISAYSKAQLWRLDIARREVSDVLIEGWRDFIKRLRPEFRSGPQYLLSQGYEVRGEFRRAVAEALWLPYIYPENEILAARALFDSVEDLDRAGLKRESQSLAIELIARYPWSREASQTRSKLNQPVTQ